MPSTASRQTGHGLALSRDSEPTYWGGSASVAYEGGRVGYLVGGLALLAASTAERGETPEQSVFDTNLANEARLHPKRLIDRLDRTECDQSQYSVNMGQGNRPLTLRHFETDVNPRLEDRADGMEENFVHSLRQRRSQADERKRRNDTVYHSAITTIATCDTKAAQICFG